MRAYEKRGFQALLFVAWVVFCTLAGFGLYRFWLAHHPEPQYRRFLMWSSSYFLNEENGAIRYRPNENMRELVIYNDRVEYDIRYHTNNYGLVDHQDYTSNQDKSSSHHFAFVGDSFTVGSGAEPWVPKLRDKLKEKYADLEIYNLGVTGVGFSNHEKLLQFLSKSFDFPNILILAISDDFYRTEWHSLLHQENVYFCHNSESDAACLQKTPIATVIPYDLPREKIIKQIKKLPRQLKIIPPSDSSGKNANAFKLLMNMRTLGRIRAMFPNSRIHLIHLPQKEEVRNRKYSLEISKSIEKMGIHYFPALTNCAWTNKMYHVHDSHPNKKGYEALSACVENYLEKEML